MNPIRHLREELDRLEDALQRAGAALIEAEQTTDQCELRELLAAYGLGTRQPRRLEWLREMGHLQRWQEGGCDTSILKDETDAPGQSAGITKPALDRDIDAL